MPTIEAILSSHPLKRKPYNQLVFCRTDGNAVPLYKVNGSDAGECGAKEALGRAFEIHGGQCFYCATRFKAQPLRKDGPHRDHVVAESLDGSSLLHNLVIACHHCGRTKADDPAYEYRPKAAEAYLRALEKHLASCVRSLAAAKA